MIKWIQGMQRGAESKGICLANYHASPLTVGNFSKKNAQENFLDSQCICFHTYVEWKTELQIFLPLNSSDHHTFNILRNSSPKSILRYLFKFHHNDTQYSKTSTDQEMSVFFFPPSKHKGMRYVSLSRWFDVCKKHFKNISVFNFNVIFWWYFSSWNKKHKCFGKFTCALSGHTQYLVHSTRIIPTKIPSG